VDRIFISYADEDSRDAFALALLLESKGYPTCLYQLEGAATGSSHREWSRQQIQKGPAFVLIASPASLASEEVAREVDWARDYGRKPIVVLKNLTPQKLRKQRPELYGLIGNAVMAIADDVVRTKAARVLAGLRNLGLEPDARDEGRVEELQVRLLDLPVPVASPWDVWKPRRRDVVVIAALLILAVVGAHYQQGHEPVRVAVMTVQAGAGEAPDWMRRRVSDVLSAGITGTERFEVIGREPIKIWEDAGKDWREIASLLKVRYAVVPRLTTQTGNTILLSSEILEDDVLKGRVGGSDAAVRWFDLGLKVATDLVARLRELTGLRPEDLSPLKDALAYLKPKEEATFPVAGGIDPEVGFAEKHGRVFDLVARAFAQADDERDAVRQTLTAYGRALETGKSSEVAKVFVTLSRDELDAMDAYFYYLDHIRVEIKEEALKFDASGERALVTFRRADRFDDRRTDEKGKEFSVRLIALLQKTDDGWRIRSMKVA